MGMSFHFILSYASKIYRERQILLVRHKLWGSKPLSATTTGTACRARSIFRSWMASWRFASPAKLFDVTATREISVSAQRHV
jgi:hypothetical protein